MFVLLAQRKQDKIIRLIGIQCPADHYPHSVVKMITDLALRGSYICWMHFSGLEIVTEQVTRNGHEWSSILLYT